MMIYKITDKTYNSNQQNNSTQDDRTTIGSEVGAIQRIGNA